MVIKNIVLNLIGKHNILNSVAAICVCLNLGIKIKIIKKALFKFSGVQRRMTKLFLKKMKTSFMTIMRIIQLKFIQCWKELKKFQIKKNNFSFSTT